MHAVNRTMESWIIQTRNTLLRSEKENISSRLRQWESIVNECTKNEHIKAFGCIQTDLIPLPTYDQSVTDNDMKHFLRLIMEWQGLNRKMSHPSNEPKTYKEYLNKAKNWMNGSRAKHYSRTLYPHMIDCAEEYAANVANLLYPIHANTSNGSIITTDELSSSSCALRRIQKQCNRLLRDIMMYSYLVQFAQCRLRVTKTGRRVYLLCDNSITGHKSNALAKMIQKYAQLHPYVDQFPSHREEIVDYFNQQKEASFHQLFLLYQKRKTMEYSHENHLIRNTMIHSENVMQLMDFIKSNSKSADGKRVYIDNDAFSAIMSVGVMLEQKQKEDGQRINDLQQCIDQLQTNSDRQQTQQQRKQPWSSSMNQTQIKPELHIPHINCAVPPIVNNINYPYNNYDYSPHSDPFSVKFKKIVNDTEMSDVPVMQYPSTETCFNGLPPYNKDIDRSQSQPVSFAPSNLNNFVSNFNEFECDDTSMMPPCVMGAVSVDNNLFSTPNDDSYTNSNNFNDCNLNYDNMYFSSSSGPS